MSSAAFFGHRDVNYSQYSESIEKIVEVVVRNCGVNLFYNGFRDNFDIICAKTVYKIKEKFPNIKQIMVLSYHPSNNFVLPTYFDGSIYLLENECPPQYAITHTNREIIRRCDFVISGVKSDFGGAWTACEYARRLHKKVISIFDV